MEGGRQGYDLGAENACYGARGERGGMEGFPVKPEEIGAAGFGYIAFLSEEQGVAVAPLGGVIGCLHIREGAQGLKAAPGGFHEERMGIEDEVLG
jgi:hypothetical protein